MDLQQALHQRRARARATSVHSLAQAGDVVGLKRKLQESPALINERNPVMSQTPLHVAAASNRAEIVKLLLEWEGTEKAEMESKNMYGETALHLASKNGCSDVAKILLEGKANLEAKAGNGMTPLHLAVWYSVKHEDHSIVETLLHFRADASVTDNEGKTPISHLPKSPSHQKLCALIQSHLDQQMKEKAMQVRESSQLKMDALEAELQQVIGLHDLKVQLRKWAKGMLLDDRRKALGLKVAVRRPPHMAFLGNPGTGKTMVARILGKLLHMVGVLPTDKVVEVQRTDLVGEFVGHTGPRTRKKIHEAEGGILFVDEAYRLMPLQKSDDKDYGLEALEEIMSIMDNGLVVVIFAGYAEPMKRELGEMALLKMNAAGIESLMFGFRLHDNCTADAIAQLLDVETTEKQRQVLNGGLVWPMLINARENLDHRLGLDCCDVNELVTITSEDLRAGLRLLSS
ncbi:hypothetical protein GOP47_0010295 [Adiantum capillus-veneris]|uniref:AAA+ ATPase domain-containing protein n=1 Tax=Adiantum capillus-veneris TaxID=13818 RepID=A0A9D4ZG98_ADICA|nr:hypothetical protein GOP47_0010295 [Adiantum capillus-veneris]